LAAFHGHTDRVHALAFHPDGRWILTGSADGTVKVWDVFTSRSVIFRGHSDLVRSVEFLDNDHVVSRDKDYSPLSSPSTKVWHVATGEEVRPPPPRAHDGPGGITDPQAQGRSLSRLSPDGTLFAQVKYGPGLEVEVRRPSDGRLAFTLQGHTSQVSDVVFSPKGTRIATASFDGTVKLWDAATGQEVLTLRGHTVGVLCVAFSPDGTKLVSGGHDTLAVVWDATGLPEVVPADARAHRLVQSRLAEWPHKGELSERLRTEAGLDGPTRAAALRIAGLLPDPPRPRRLLEASWDVALSPGRDPRDYERALRWAEEASRRLPAPDGLTWTVLGVASYRAGRYQDAREALDRAEPLLDAVGSWPPPALFVPIHHIFGAMTLHRLGRRDEARSQLGRLRRECQERPGEYFLSRPLLGEAEALIDPQAAGPPTGARSSHRAGSP
jgi:WD40 repeat protein